MGLVAIIRSWIPVILVLFLEEWATQCHGCSEHERTALLQIKPFFNRPSPSVYEGSPWGTDADCCKWAGVWCNETTNRVTELELWDSVDPGSGGRYLNASLFLPFKDLTSLDLSRNKILGCIENEGFEKLSRLAHLEDLYLAYNEFNSSILSSLGGLSSLKTLDLSYNRLKGGFEKLSRLAHLETLCLAGNEFSSSILSSLRGLSSLKTLDLSNNSLKGKVNIQGSYYLNNLKKLLLDYSTVDDNFLQSIRALVSLQILSMQYLNASQLTRGWPHLKSLKELQLSCTTTLNYSMLQTVGNLISLEDLSMSGCQLSGLTSIAQGICELNQLEDLDISYNNLSGTLPPCMANLTSLGSLNLSYNQLIGNISLSPLRTLKSLESLDLSYNQFQIPVTLSPFFNHTKLNSLFAQGNNIFAEVEQYSLTPKFQLTDLYLSGDGYSEMFPKFLYYQRNLANVDLSHIQLSGGFPYWLLENNTGLFTLALVNNSLSGQLWLPSHLNMTLGFLDISENCLRGHVPALIGAYLPKLWYLNMSGNGFNGTIPPSLGNMSFLELLDLSNNRLSGEVSGQLATSCFLLLSNNSLQGEIPNSLFNSSTLTIFDLSHNNIHGRLPQWTGNMNALLVLDLSDNNIFGDLPSNFPSSIKLAILSKNRLQGSLEKVFYNSSNLEILDLGHNYFTGNIPKWIGTFSNLNYLLLDNNYIEGEIPIQLCKLKDISLIDFSYNHLSGHILPCMRSRSNWDRTHTFESSWDRTHIFGSTYNRILPNMSVIFQPQVEFTTKTFYYSYKGRTLFCMSGIDLSNNNLTGKIPPELGNLSTIKVLNLSHNSFTGPIPSTFSNLKEIESLDLSCNNLDGKIPPQLTQLNELAVFTVAHNNLSGKTPEMVAQFATFESRSYEDNPLLCGPPLNKSCNAHLSPSSSSNNTEKNEEETGWMNMDAFYPSFLASYSVALLGTVAILYINPHWRQAWFYFVEACINNCFYFIVDNLPMLSKYRAWQPCA